MPFATGSVSVMSSAIFFSDASNARSAASGTLTRNGRIAVPKSSAAAANGTDAATSAAHAR